ncbi:MAG: hypothetical protein ABJC12_09865, partial [Saprospiraceae bacterium]
MSYYSRTPGKCRSLFASTFFLSFTFCCLLFCAPLFSQRPVYKITAEIDTFGTDTIKGTIEISWTNRSNSP